MASRGDVSCWDEYAEAELDRVLGGSLAVKHPRHRHALHGGGEWEPLLDLPRETRRTLVGARLLAPSGWYPDELHQVVADGVGHAKIPDVAAAVDWWVDLCLAMIIHRRRVAHFRRHHTLATRNGYQTYWYYRKDHPSC